jgi:hypothetical protein
MLDADKVKTLLKFLYNKLDVHSVEEAGQTAHGIRYIVDIGYNNSFPVVREELLEKAKNLGFHVSASTNPDDDLGFTIWN